MKKVKVQEILKDGGIYHIRVSDMEFGGTMFYTFHIEESNYDKSCFYEGSVLYVEENEDRTITSVWMKVPVLLPQNEPEVIDDQGHFI